MEENEREPLIRYIAVTAMSGMLDRLVLLQFALLEDNFHDTAVLSFATFLRALAKARQTPETKDGVKKSIRNAVRVELNKRVKMTAGPKRQFLIGFINTHPLLKIPTPVGRPDGSIKSPKQKEETAQKFADEIEAAVRSNLSNDDYVSQLIAYTGIEYLADERRAVDGLKNGTLTRTVELVFRTESNLCRRRRETLVGRFVLSKQELRMKRSISAHRHCWFLILLLLVACSPAMAQTTGEGLGGTFNTPNGGTITRTIVDRIAQRNRERKPTTGRPGLSSTARASSLGSTAPGAKPSDASVLFRSTGTQLKTREIANLIDAGNPQVVQLLTTLLEEFDKGARAAGHPNDLALALSFFFATNASLYHGGGQPADPPMVELRDTIAEALVEGNALSSMSDRQKQEMYETLVLFTGFALAVYEEGKGGNAESLKVSRQLAGEYLLAVTGISPDKINFTKQGLSIEREAVAGTTTKSNTEPANSGNAPAATFSSSDFLDSDPFPDKPYVQPQQPLVGRLRKTITMTDLAGTWEIGGASVTTYVSSGTNTHTDASFFGKKYSIHSDGTFDSKFQGRASNTTIRETDSGTVVLDGGFITMRSRQNPAMRYQFVAFMNQANGAAVLSLIYVGESPPLDGNALRANCGHAHGYVTCLNGEEWVRIP